MPATKIAIIHQRGKNQSAGNTLAEAAAIGAKLARLGAKLQDATKIEIVPKRFFGRASIANSVFTALTFGDNGEHFEVTILLDEVASADDFGTDTTGGGGKPPQGKGG